MAGRLTKCPVAPKTCRDSQFTPRPRALRVEAFLFYFRDTRFLIFGARHAPRRSRRFDAAFALVAPITSPIATWPRFVSSIASTPPTPRPSSGTGRLAHPFALVLHGRI